MLLSIYIFLGANNVHTFTFYQSINWEMGFNFINYIFFCPHFIILLLYISHFVSYRIQKDKKKYK